MNNQEFPRKPIGPVESMKDRCGAHGARRRGNVGPATSIVGVASSHDTIILAFKGGTAIKKCYVPDYRFS